MHEKWVCNWDSAPNPLGELIPPYLHLRSPLRGKGKERKGEEGERKVGRRNEINFWRNGLVCSSK